MLLTRLPSCIIRDYDGIWSRKLLTPSTILGINFLRSQDTPLLSIVRAKALYLTKLDISPCFVSLLLIEHEIIDIIDIIDIYLKLLITLICNWFLMTLLQICLLGLVVSDNSTIGDHSITEDTSEISNIGNNLAVDAVDQVKRFLLTFTLYRSQSLYSAWRIRSDFRNRFGGNPSFLIGSETWRIAVMVHIGVVKRAKWLAARSISRFE